MDNNLPDLKGSKLNKFAEKSNKDQGERPATGAQGRSLGSEFAYAVGNLKEQAKKMKGSQNAFLGVPTQRLDPKDFNHSLISPKGKKKYDQGDE